MSRPRSGVRRYARHVLGAFVVAVVTLVALPVLATPRDGAFEGSTSQERQIRFTVESMRIDLMSIVIVHSDCDLRIAGFRTDVRVRMTTPSPCD
jgi:hypothetical protein